MNRSTFDNLSYNETFAMLNKLQAENSALKSELLAAKMQLSSYKNVLGTEEEAQLERQAAIIQNEEETITLDDLIGPIPADLDDDFTPQMKI